MEDEKRVDVQEFINFANAIVPDSTESISYLKSGEVWLELLNLVEEDTVKADKINKGKDLSDKECKKNYKALKKALTKKGVEYLPALDDNIDDILNGDEKLNYEVASWFKQYFEENADTDTRQKIQNDIDVLSQNRESDFPAEITVSVEGDDAEANEATDQEEDDIIATDEEAKPGDEAKVGEEEGVAEAGGEEGIAGEEAAGGDDEATDDEIAEATAEGQQEVAAEGGEETTPVAVDEVTGEDKINESITEPFDEFPEVGEEPADEAPTYNVTVTPDETSVEEETPVPDENMEEEINTAEENAPEDVAEDLGEEEASLGMDEDAHKTIKKVALLATCGALIMCAVACGCYYRSRCGSSTGPSKSGGLFARLKSAFTKPQCAKITANVQPVGGSATKTAEITTLGASAKTPTDISSDPSSRGTDEEEIPEKIIKKLWDWFQEDPAMNAYIYLEKRK